MLRRLKRLLGLGPDEYAIFQHQPKKQVVERLDEPIGPDYAEMELGLEPGRYSLREVHSGQFGSARWTHDVGDVERASEIEELREGLRRLEGALQNGGGQAAPIDPDSVQEAIQLSLLSDSSFVEAHGDEVVKWAFSSSDSALGDPDVDLSLSSPVDLLAYRGASDPESTAAQLEGAAERLGGAVRRGLRGADRDGEGPDNVFDSVDDRGAPDVDEAAESGPRKSTEEVAELSEGFGGPRRDGAAETAPSPHEPTISEEEADRIAGEVAEAVEG